MTDASTADPALAAAQAAEAVKDAMRAKAAADAIEAFVDAYSKASTAQSVTLDYQCVAAGLAVIFNKVWTVQDGLGSELSSWIGLLQTSGYEGMSNKARDRFSTALSTALQATFEVPTAIEDLYFGCAEAAKAPGAAAKA